jgi:MFS family permease
MQTLDTPALRYESNYRWVILGMIALTGFITVGFPITSLSVLFSEIAESLDLDLLQIGIIWGVGSFMGIFTALIGGPIIDYVGTRRSIIMTCILVGFLGALRGFATDFWTLSIYSFLLGIVQVTIPINLIKLNLQWFAPRQLGLASGIMSFGFATGLLLGARLGASFLSPAMGGWRNVIIITGIAGVLLGFLWIFVHPADKSASTSKFEWSSLFNSIGNVAQFRYLWILGFIGFGVSGLMFGMIGYVPSYLREIGWAGLDADTAISLFFFSSLIGVVPLSYLSDKIRDRRKVMIFAAAMMTVGTTIIFFANDRMFWVFTAMIIAGFAFDAFMAIQSLSLSRLDGIPMALAGTSLGFGIMIRNIGTSISPPLGNSLTEIGLNLPFLLWAGFGFMSLILLLFYYKEQGKQKVN